MIAHGILPRGTIKIRVLQNCQTARESYSRPNAKASEDFSGQKLLRLAFDGESKAKFGFTRSRRATRGIERLARWIPLDGYPPSAYSDVDPARLPWDHAPAGRDPFRAS